MRDAASRTPVLVVLLTTGMLGLAGCRKAVPAAPPQSAPEVIVSRPVVREVTDYFEFPGRMAAVKAVDVRARVSGHLVKVNFQDGQPVTKGDLLFEIDPRPYQAALDNAVGDLNRLQAMLIKAQADLTRAERLRPSGAISQEGYELAVSQLAIARASILSAKAAVRTAELNLEFTRITSPIDGQVSRTQITEGNLVQPGASEATVLTTVVALNPVYAYFNIDEQALLQYMESAKRSGEGLSLEQHEAFKIPVEIGLAHEKGFPHTGVLDFTDNKVDSGTGTIRARGVFDNSGGFLKPGLFVRVRIPFGRPHQALLVPERAISRDQRQKFVLTVNKENMVQYRQVEVGSPQDDLRVVTSGLQPDEWVIVDGLQRARPGAKVTGRPLEDGVAASAAYAGRMSDAAATRTARN